MDWKSVGSKLRAALSLKRIDQIVNLGRTQLKRRLIASWDEIGPEVPANTSLSSLLTHTRRLY